MNTTESTSTGRFTSRSSAVPWNGGTNLDAVTHMRRSPRAGKRDVLALAREPFVASIVMFASIVILRFSVHASQRTGILLLLIGPIVIVSLAHRPLAGTVMATAGL